MPFYKVPSPNSTSLPDVKRVRAPLRQSQASSPDHPPHVESRTSGSSTAVYSGSSQNFEGVSDNGAYVNGGGGGGAGGRGGTGGGGGWVEGTNSNPAHRHPLSADMNGSRHHHVEPPDQQVSIVELEIQKQSEREAELIALRQSLYQQQTSVQSPVTPDPRINRTSTGPERTPSSDPRSRMPSAPEVTNHRALSPPHPSSSSVSASTVSPSVVTYEEAISTRAHPGESLIAREIMELKMREEELKRNRKGLGRIPPDSTSGVDHVRHPTTPVQSMPLSLESSTSSSSSAQSFGAHPRHDAVDGDIRPRSRPSRIRPLDEPDAEEVKFHPQMETPIDREMRQAREREDALRQARGLPARADEESMVVEMRMPDATGSTYRGSSSSGGDQKTDQTMKKLASSRLMVEIEKEKQRELEVRRHNQHPSHNHGNASAGPAAAGHQGNAKSSSYMRKY